MAFSVECSGCDRVMELPEDSAGRKVKCSQCGTRHLIQATDGGTLYLTSLDEVEREAPAPRSPRTRDEAPARVRTRGGSGGGRSRSRPSGRRRSKGRSSRDEGGRSGGQENRRRGREGRDRVEGATGALVMGILSLVCCGLIGIGAIFSANSVMNACKRAGDPVPGTATAGLILGIIGLIREIAGLLYLATHPEILEGF